MNNKANPARVNIGCQGELRIDRISERNMDFKEFKAERADGWIMSHSEQGNHHVLERKRGTEVVELNNAPAGLQILQVIVDEPTKLFQDAAVPHAPIMLDEPGIYEFRIKREFNPFSEEARRVAD